MSAGSLSTSQGHIQDSSTSEVTAISEVCGSHHVLWVEHLLRELRHAHGTEGVSTTTREGCEANHEEMQTREGNHVDSQFAKIGVKLTRET